MDESATFEQSMPAQELPHPTSAENVEEELASVEIELAQPTLEASIEVEEPEVHVTQEVIGAEAADPVVLSADEPRALDEPTLVHDTPASEIHSITSEDIPSAVEAPQAISQEEDTPAPEIPAVSEDAAAENPVEPHTDHSLLHTTDEESAAVTAEEGRIETPGPTVETEISSTPKAEIAIEGEKPDHERTAAEVADTYTPVIDHQVNEQEESPSTDILVDKTELDNMQDDSSPVVTGEVEESPIVTPQDEPIVESLPEDPIQLEETEAPVTIEEVQDTSLEIKPEDDSSQSDLQAQPASVSIVASAEDTAVVEEIDDERVPDSAGDEISGLLNSISPRSFLTET